jgi:GNAT superfamily N-acetyltransferase
VTLTRALSTVGKLRRMPALTVFRKVAHLVPFRPFDAAKLCFLRYDGVPRVPPALLRGRGIVRRGTPADVDALTALQHKRSIFASRFAAGDHCMVAVADGRIVGYEWLCERPIHLEGEWLYPIRIPPGCVYAYDAYIDPAFRNGGVWLRFKAYLGEWMTVRGMRAVITFVEHGNAASWRTHLRFGFVPTMTVRAVRVCGRTFFRTTILSGDHGMVLLHETSG